MYDGISSYIWKIRDHIVGSSNSPNKEDVAFGNTVARPIRLDDEVR